MEALLISVSYTHLANKDSLLLLENRLSNVISLLSIEPDNNKKSLLENEYYNLLKELKNLRKRLS